MRSRRIRTAIFVSIAAAASASAAPPAIGLDGRLPPIASPALGEGVDPETQPLGAVENTAIPLHETRALGGEAQAPAVGVSRTLGALVGVIGVMLVLFMGFRRLSARRGGLIASLGAAGRAPSGVIEVLARYPIARTQRIVVLRIGSRVVVCCQSSAGRAANAGMTTLTELTDPEEVASLLRTVRDIDGRSNAAAFRSALKDAEFDPATAECGRNPLQYESPEGDSVKWRDERIQIPQPRAPQREMDPSIGRMRARLAAMRTNGDAA